MNWHIHTGRAEDILPTLAPNSFDGVLCDPSYGLNTVNTDRVIAWRITAGRHCNTRCFSKEY